MQKNYDHMKSFALSLAFMMRFKTGRKWDITETENLLSDPASTYIAMIPGLKTSVPRSVVIIPHGRGCHGLLSNTTIFHSQRNITRI